MLVDTQLINHCFSPGSRGGLQNHSIWFQMDQNMSILKATRAIWPHLGESLIFTNGETRLRGEELWLSTHNSRTGTKSRFSGFLSSSQNLKEFSNKQQRGLKNWYYLSKMSYLLVFSNSLSHSLSCFLLLISFFFFFCHSSSLFLLTDIFLCLLQFVLQDSAQTSPDGLVLKFSMLYVGSALWSLWSN